MLIKDDAPPAKKIGVRVWPKAIPQFNVGHLEVVQVRRCMHALHRHLHCTASLAGPSLCMPVLLHTTGSIAAQPLFLAAISTAVTSGSTEVRSARVLLLLGQAAALHTLEGYGSNASACVEMFQHTKTLM